MFIKTILILTFLALISTTNFAQYEKSGVGIEVGYARYQGEFSNLAPGGARLGIDIRQEVHPHIKLGLLYNSSIASNVNSTWLTKNWEFQHGAVKAWFHKKTEDDYYSTRGSGFDPFIALAVGYGVMEEPFLEKVDGAKKSTPFGSFELGTEYKHYTFSYRLNYSGNLPDPTKFYPEVAGEQVISHTVMIALRFRVNLTIKEFIREFRK